MESTGSRIKSLRLQTGLDQREFGELFDLGQSAVSEWEAGKKFPRVETLLAMSEKFHVSIDWILKGTESVAAESPAAYQSFPMAGYWNEFGYRFEGLRPSRDREILRQFMQGSVREHIKDIDQLWKRYKHLAEDDDGEKTD